MARKKKRKANPTINAWRTCGKQVGVKPFKKWTPKQKKAAKACVIKKLGRKGK